MRRIPISSSLLPGQTRLINAPCELICLFLWAWSLIIHRLVQQHHYPRRKPKFRRVRGLVGSVIYHGSCLLLSFFFCLLIPILRVSPWIGHPFLGRRRRITVSTTSNCMSRPHHQGNPRSKPTMARMVAAGGAAAVLRDLARARSVLQWCK